MRSEDFNERDLPISFNDVDFCIRVRQAGYKIIWTPHAKLFHYESLSRGKPETKSEKASQAYLRSRWAPVLDNDPAYNPNLSLKKEFKPVGIGEPTRVRKPWLEFAAARSSSSQAGSKRPSPPHLAERPQL